MSKIFKVSFDKKASRSKTIAELFDSIQFYRNEGRSITEIFEAFSNSGLWSKGRSSFSCEYYAYRRSQKDDASNKKVFLGQKNEKTISTNNLVDEAVLDVSEVNSDSDMVPNRENSRPLTFAERRAASAEVFKRKLSKG